MAIRKRDMIQDAIRRYLEGRLFVYFDQIDKKEEMSQTFQNHMVRLIDTIKLLVSTHQANQWIERATSLAHTDFKHKKIHKVKEEVGELFDDDFFHLFDEMELEDVLSINNTIDTLFLDITTIEEKAGDIVKSTNVENYLEQFISKNPSIDHENYKD